MTLRNAAFRIPPDDQPNVAQPLSIAVTGSTTSPSIDTTLDMLGKENTLASIDKLLETIEKP